LSKIGNAKDFAIAVIVTEPSGLSTSPLDHPKAFVDWLTASSGGAVPREDVTFLTLSEVEKGSFTGVGQHSVFIDEREEQEQHKQLLQSEQQRRESFDRAFEPLLMLG